MRQAIYSAPYAQIAGTAESVHGGIVSASEIHISGTPIVDSNGSWVGPPLASSWSLITGIPGGFSDGVDDVLSEAQVDSMVSSGAIDLASDSTMRGANIVTSDSDQDSLAMVSCLNDQVLRHDTALAQWYCSESTDSLQALSCTHEQVAHYDQGLSQWVCSDQLNALNALGCQAGQVAYFNGSGWTCEQGTILFDQDEDGTPSWEDCNDNESSSYTNSEDADYDGFLVDEDCDNNDPTSYTIYEDADCDGAAAAEDCDDNDPSSTLLAADGDCDDVVAAEDCDDADASSTIQAHDADCDGVETADDCDDADPSSTTVATDADCDLDLASTDCNDNDSTVYNDAIETCDDGIDQDCNGVDDPCSLCGNILHPDSVGGPSGWTLCFIDETDVSYHSTDCRDLLEGIPAYDNAANLLAAGGNFGCWHGISGSQEGATYAGNNVVSNSCRDNIQHSNQLDDWNPSNTTFGVCIRYP